MHNIFRTFRKSKNHCGKCKIPQPAPAEKCNYVIVDRDGDIRATVCGTAEEAVGTAMQMAREEGKHAPFVVYKLQRERKVSIETIEEE